MSFLPWNMCLFQQHEYDISWIKRHIIKWMGWVFIYGLKWVESIENGQSLSIDNYGYKTKALQIILNTCWLKRFYWHLDAESF